MHPPTPFMQVFALSRGVAAPLVGCTMVFGCYSHKDHQRGCPMKLFRMKAFFVLFAASALIFLMAGAGQAADKDGNPPGKKGGPGTNWENPPGPAGGPGASPDKRGVPPPDKRPPKKVFCDRHPNDPKCTGAPPPSHVGLPPQATPPGPPPGHSKFCQKHPWHKKCQGYNPPGPAGGPGKGPRDLDNNPPGPKGGPGTNWENPKGPAGGPGASPNRKGPPPKGKKK